MNRNQFCRYKIKEWKIYTHQASHQERIRYHQFNALSATTFPQIFPLWPHPSRKLKNLNKKTLFLPCTFINYSNNTMKMSKGYIWERDTCMNTSCIHTYSKYLSLGRWMTWHTLCVKITKKSWLAWFNVEFLLGIWHKNFSFIETS